LIDLSINREERGMAFCRTEFPRKEFFDGRLACCTPPSHRQLHRD